MAMFELFIEMYLLFMNRHKTLMSDERQHYNNYLINLDREYRIFILKKVIMNKLEKQFNICQERYDNMIPEDEECEHKWIFIGSIDYRNFYKCKICGKESE
jgi:hypothetical protein